MQHHLGTNLFKGGVYETRDTVWDFLPAEKIDIWSRWKGGQSLHEIGRAFDKPHTIHSRVLLPSRRHPSRRSSPLAASTHPG